LGLLRGKYSRFFRFWLGQRLLSNVHFLFQGISATVAWSLNLCDSDMPSSEHLSALVQKRPEENVHSPGRPLADRNVLYKYLNPNLFAVVVEGKHPVHKSELFSFLQECFWNIV